MLPVLQLPGEGQGPDVHSPYEYILQMVSFYYGTGRYKNKLIPRNGSNFME